MFTRLLVMNKIRMNYFVSNHYVMKDDYLIVVLNEKSEWMNNN